MFCPVFLLAYLIFAQPFFNVVYAIKVSFVRHRDLHILTVGSYTYTTDQRFVAIHKKDADEWTLQIKWVQHRDAGVCIYAYVCIMKVIYLWVVVGL